MAARAKMMSDSTRTIVLAVVAATFVSVIGPLAVGWNARIDKQQDYQRQDQVAATLRIENEKRAAASKAIDQKLVIIHTLVNSNLTAAMQSEFDARTAELVTLVELVDLKRAHGKLPNKVTTDRIAATESKLKELRKTLDKRQEDQLAADAAAAANAATPSPPVKVEIVDQKQPVPVKIAP